jgi:hypothetical protein
VEARLGPFAVAGVTLVPDHGGFTDQVRNGGTLDAGPLGGPACRRVELALAAQESSAALIAAKETNPVFEA